MSPLTTTLPASRKTEVSANYDDFYTFGSSFKTAKSVTYFLDACLTVSLVSDSKDFHLLLETSIQ